MLFLKLCLTHHSPPYAHASQWLLDILQKKAWMYWESRSSNITVGGLGWDMQYAFRGHLVVLINEHTSSDGEAFARGVSELGLGKLVGKRTWGGGIWLSSDNKLVDGGIASAPEVGTYNDKVREIFLHCLVSHQCCLLSSPLFLII